MNLFATPVPGMVYDNKDDPEGTPVTIIGLESNEDGSPPAWDDVLVVDGDGILKWVNSKFVVFVGLAPTHTTTLEAMGGAYSQRPSLTQAWRSRS